jgi:DNA-binding MarR family transcriptional regulator
MASEDDLGPRLSGRLSYLLKRALLDLHALQDEHLEPSGVNGRELAVLLLLDGREPESQQQAAQRLGVDRTTMVALLDGLEDKGLVGRRPDPEDRRRNVVDLTKTGRAALRRALRASDQAEARLLEPLDETEAAQLRLLLAGIARPRAHG